MFYYLFNSFYNLLISDPEPVQNLDVIVNHNNGTVTVNWNPIVEINFVLLYQLFYTSVTKTSECAIISNTMFLPAVNFLIF